MAELQFYAARADIEDVLAYVFDREWHVYEQVGKRGAEPHRFAAPEDVLAEYDAKFAGNDEADSGTLFLHVWAPETKAEPKIEDGEVEGWGLIQLQIAGVGKRKIGVSRFAHNTAKRAWTWSDVYAKELGDPDDWDWDELERLSRKFRYHVSTKLAVRKDRNGIVRPVLRQADELTKQGYELALN